MATVGKSQIKVQKNVCSPGLFSFTCMQEEDYVWIMILWHVCFKAMSKYIRNDETQFRDMFFLKYYAVLQFSSLISIATSVQIVQYLH